MDRALRPERFDIDPSSPTAARQWKHWLFTFKNYINSSDASKTDKFQLLANHVNSEVFEYIADCDSYDKAIKALTDIYVKPKSLIYARHLLSTCKQNSAENLDQYLQTLKRLAKDCDFQSVSGEQYRDETIRDSFIRGIRSNNIRQRLLEQDSLDLSKIFRQARTLEAAELQSQTYDQTRVPTNETCAVQPTSDAEADSISKPCDQSLSVAVAKCFFCGYNKHPRSKCPAKDAVCKNCNKVGHFHRVCRSNPVTKTTNSLASNFVSSPVIAAVPASLSRAVVTMFVNDIPMNALVDTGSSDSYISSDLVKSHKWTVYPSSASITMASTSLSSSTDGHCFVKLRYRDTDYTHVKLSLLPKLCSDILLGHDFLKQHEHIQIDFGGSKPGFLCGLTPAQVELPTLFGTVPRTCKPIATKSRRLPPSDQRFVQDEIRRLLTEEIIEPSNSPWRAQVLVTTNENHKRRMVVDYSQTVNRFTQLDAYPLPRIDDLIEKISQYEMFSTLDLRSAYHQIPIREDEKCFTAFEACGNLYQFRRIPFGVTNGVACFQRIIDSVIRKAGLSDTYAYVDNVTICGRDPSEHDENLTKFMTAAKDVGLTFNEEKSIIGARTITLLGYQVKKGIVKPDPERFRALRELPVPSDLKSQQRIVGMFAYYSHWISHFSDKISTLSHNLTFPLPEHVKKSFGELKMELEHAAVVTVDNKTPLVVETDASDIAIAATLNQAGRPVAFFSRTLTPSERNHSSVEKEAYAIVEALRKWKHYLSGVHFKLVTDQRSVAFMFDEKHKGKVKNDKIIRWRIELSCFSYDVVYRPGRDNLVADALSRGYCGSVTSLDLKTLHEALCHPGVTRMLHFVRSRNLTFSIQEIKQMTANCGVCSEIKPRFANFPSGQLVKATQPFERLSLDFKGPIPSKTHNKYLLTVIDEFSRFPFAFPCSDLSASSVVNCLVQLFSTFGTPAFIHSDRGSAFMSTELKTFLHDRGVATSRTTPYNPGGNGQVERLNSTLWQTILLALKSKHLPVNNWESVLVDALHSVRSLLCTATNATPHERMFGFNRRTPAGTALPNWLTPGNCVLLKNHNRKSKYDTLVEEVELLECNPQYAHVRLSNGKEDTVSLHHLAPKGEIIDPPAAEETVNFPHNNDVLNDGSSSTSPTSLPNAPESSIEQRSSTADDYEIMKSTQQRVHPYNLRNRQA